MYAWLHYLITKAGEVGCSAASAFDPELTASSNFGPYELVYVCSGQVVAVSLMEAAASYASCRQVLIGNCSVLCKLL